MRRLHIHDGDRFGKLTAVQPETPSATGKHRWLFRCDCGTETVVIVSSAKDGKTKSCGCLRRAESPRLLYDLRAGDRFNQLVAIRRVENVGRIRAWLFKCDCGNETVVRSGAVACNKTKSCGCGKKATPGYCSACGTEKPVAEFHKNATICRQCSNTQHSVNRKHRLKTNPDTAIKEKRNRIKSRSQNHVRARLILDKLKRNASGRGYSFILVLSDILKLGEKQNWACARTGIPLDMTIDRGQRPFGPSIDRIDNSRGYEPNNIQLVCYMYNMCKNRFSDEDVFTFSNAVIETSWRSLEQRLQQQLKLRKVA